MAVFTNKSDRQRLVVVWEQVVQEIKVLRGSVLQRERESAERATLVRQEKLVRAKVQSLCHLSQSLPLAE